MTFIVKTRGAGRMLIAEYLCPEHGVFEALVDRDANGDAPTTRPCPELLATEIGEDETEHLPCGYAAPWTISAPKPKVWSVSCVAAVRGGDMKDRPPGMLDTRPLAEGMKYSEWRKVQDNARRARRHKMLVDKGVIQRKVIVG